MPSLSLRFLDTNQWLFRRPDLAQRQGGSLLLLLFGFLKGGRWEACFHVRLFLQKQEGWLEP